MQTVGAACEPVQLVGQLPKNQGDPKRHHEPGEIGPAQNGGTAQRAQDAGHGHAYQQTQERIGHHQLGKQRRRIRAHAKESSMPERHNAGVTQNQIQRQGEQGDDGNLVDDQRVVGQQQGRGQRQQPQRVLPQLPTAALEQEGL